MREKIKKRKRKINKVKAGFVPGNVLMILMFSGFSFGCLKDVSTTAMSIFTYRDAYEEAMQVKSERVELKEDLMSMEVKLQDDEFLEGYIRASMFYTKENETVIVIQAIE